MWIEDSYLARRRFLYGMIGGGAAALGAGAVGPLAQYVGNFRQQPPPDFLVLSKAECDILPGTAKMVMYGRIPALLIKLPEPQSELKVFVATCSHLNCTVNYQPEANRIFCACHEGCFDTDGQVLSGPPPLPLRTFYHKLKPEGLVIALEEKNLEKAS